MHVHTSMDAYPVVCYILVVERPRRSRASNEPKPVVDSIQSYGVELGVRAGEI